MSDQTVAEDFARSIHDLEADSEHISITSSDPTEIQNAEFTGAVELNTVRATYQMSDWSHGTRYLFELYEEGFLKVRAWKNKHLVQDTYLALRYLKPASKVTRIVARRSLKAAAGLLLATAIAAITSFVLPYDQLFRSVSIVLGSGSIVSFMLFLYLTYEQTHFFSATGKCEVLRLRGSVVTFRTCRTIADELCQAITAAQAQNTDDWPIYLRKEMHEHYRLQRAGVISDGACSSATREILSRFD